MAGLIRRDDERALANPRSAAEWDPFQRMRALMRWDPFREFGFYEPGRYGEAGTFSPSFEVKEQKDSYLVKADLPGVKEQDLEISLSGDRLTISGKREAEKEQEEGTYYAYECSYGSFSRSFTLPEGVDADHASAEIKDGVLTLVLPRKKESQAKRILLRKGGAKA